MKHLVITVHGIRTFGGWQERFEKLLKDQVNPEDVGCLEVNNYKLGWFSVIGFLIPFSRWLVVRRFRSEFLKCADKAKWDRIDLVGHSFGTHLIGWGLYGIPNEKRPGVHTIILAGSVLKPSFPWLDLVGSCVQRVVSDCGIHDRVLILNQIVVLFTGMAGRIGFAGMTGDNFQNRYFKFGHSGYFEGSKGADDTFMREKWVPLILCDLPIPDFGDPRSNSAVSGVITVVLNNLEPIKLAVYVSPLLIVVWILSAALVEARRQKSIALDKEHSAKLAQVESDRQSLLSRINEWAATWAGRDAVDQRKVATSQKERAEILLDESDKRRGELQSQSESLFYQLTVSGNDVTAATGLLNLHRPGAALAHLSKWGKMYPHDTATAFLLAELIGRHNWLIREKGVQVEGEYVTSLEWDDKERRIKLPGYGPFQEFDAFFHRLARGSTPENDEKSRRQAFIGLFGDDKLYSRPEVVGQRGKVMLAIWNNPLRLGVWDAQSLVCTESPKEIHFRVAHTQGEPEKPELRDWDALAISPDGNKILVARRTDSHDALDGRIAVIDSQDYRVSAVGDVGEGIQRGEFGPEDRVAIIRSLPANLVADANFELAVWTTAKTEQSSTSDTIELLAEPTELWNNRFQRSAKPYEWGLTEVRFLDKDTLVCLAGDYLWRFRLLTNAFSTRRVAADQVSKVQAYTSRKIVRSLQWKAKILEGDRIEVINIAAKTRRILPRMHKENLHSIEYLADGRLLLSYARYKFRGNETFIWDLASGLPLLNVNRVAPPECSMPAVAFDESGSHMFFYSARDTDPRYWESPEPTEFWERDLFFPRTIPTWMCDLAVIFAGVQLEGTGVYVGIEDGESRFEKVRSQVRHLSSADELTRWIQRRLDLATKTAGG